MRRVILSLTLLGAVLVVAGCDDKGTTAGGTVSSGQKPSSLPAPPTPPQPK